MHGHLPDLIQRQPCVVPRLHSANEIAGKLRVTRAEKETDDFIELLVGLQNKKDRLVGVEQPARPNGKHGRAADAKRTFDMASAKRQHHAGINEHIVLVLDGFLEKLRRKAAHVGQVAEHFRAFRVQLLHPRIISRCGRRGGERVIGEAFHILKLQERIEAPFITNRAAEPVADVRAARRAVPMRRVNNHAIGELQVKIAQGVELLFGQLFLLVACRGGRAARRN